jgi:phosphotransferase system  glucose/maltose/N-acetylglucosamine-specific IIC component
LIERQIGGSVVQPGTLRVREASMWIRQELQVKLLSLYQRFERVIISILTALIAIIVLVAVWNLAVKVVFGLTLSESLDPSDYAIFQAVFGMIFIVIVALGLKKSLLVIAGRRDNVVQIRAVVLTALLAR